MMVQFLNYHIIIRICGFSPSWKNLGRLTYKVSLAGAVEAGGGGGWEGCGSWCISYINWVKKNHQTKYSLARIEQPTKQAEMLPRHHPGSRWPPI